ncbi:MAG: hypothetical protein K0S01_1815 [Herbinix sp.]|jgi:uncharacterized beta-barrel protein YwiB (DUF1934 family)|nr:hypothetical protein [Herbinix sp.]
MTKEVSISIEGLQLGSEEDSIVMTALGTYHLYNDKHYIQYDEKPEEGEGAIKCMVKIALTKIELSKKGVNSSQMVFDLKEETIAYYQTPFGNLSFDVNTTEIIIEESPEQLQVKLEYSLSSNASLISNNQIIIKIESIG